jgi:hypothetical protein
MITTYEQEGIKKGIEKGKQEMLILQLEKKFRKLKAAEKQRIRQIDSGEKLNRLLLSVLDADSLDDLEF